MNINLNSTLLREKKTVYIYWADGLQLLMKSLVERLKNRDDIKLFVLCLSEVRAEEASLYIDRSRILLPNDDFRIEHSTSAVKAVLNKLGSNIYFAERHFSSDRDFLNSIYECEKEKFVGLELLRRIANFFTLIEESGGVLISECKSDMLSTFGSHFQNEVSNFYHLTVQGSRIFSDNSDIYFIAATDYEEPVVLNNLGAISNDEIYRAYLRTRLLLNSEITSVDVYKDVPKSLSDGLMIKKYTNTKKVIFFPLQYFPENATLGDCLGAADQVWLVNLLSRGIPFDSELWVKDHFVFTENDGGRLDAFKNIPNLRIIPNSISVSSVLENVDLLITASSSAGMEAIYRNIPVICFGKPLYKDHPLVECLNLMNMSPIVLQAHIEKIFSEIRNGDEIENARLMDSIIFKIASQSFISRSNLAPFPYTDSVCDVLIEALDVLLGDA